MKISFLNGLEGEIFKVSTHTIVKPMIGLSFSASKNKSPIRNRSSEAAGAAI